MCDATILVGENDIEKKTNWVITRIQLIFELDFYRRVSCRVIW